MNERKLSNKNEPQSNGIVAGVHQVQKRHAKTQQKMKET